MLAASVGSNEHNMRVWMKNSILPGKVTVTPDEGPSLEILLIFFQVVNASLPTKACLKITINFLESLRL
jgi:hypothetical protein